MGWLLDKVTALADELRLQQAVFAAHAFAEFLVQEAAFAHVKQESGVRSQDRGTQTPEPRTQNLPLSTSWVSPSFTFQTSVKYVSDMRSCQVRPSLSTNAQMNPSISALIETR